MINIYLIFIPAEAASLYSQEILNPADLHRLTALPALASRTGWRTARLGKFWCGQNLPQQPICLSHKNGASLLAVGLKEKPGVDLESIRSRDVHGLSKHIGTARECEWIARSTAPMIDFYRLWTIKESLIKAEDLNFPSDMKCVGFDWVKEDRQILRSTKERNYLWLNARLGSDFLLAAVWPDIANERITLTIHQPYGSALSISDLQTNAHSLILHQNQSVTSSEKARTNQ